MTSKKPNILLITSDQQHWNTLGLINDEISTPNLDRLAAQGTYFDHAYTCNPTCTPTRASMITGKYPSQHGAWTLGTKLPESEHTIGEDFSDAGYKTALVGKAHFQPLASTEEFSSLEAYPVLQDLDFWREFDEPFYGFDHVELARNHTNEAHAGQHYALWMEEKGLKNWRDYYLPPTGTQDGSPHIWQIPEEYHYDAWIAERTNALLDQYQNNDNNFFLWASFFDPHPACMAPKRWAEMYDPEKITVPQVVSGEHDANPPHFKLTQEDKPDFTPYYEPDGNGCHGFHSHLHDQKDQAKEIAVYYGMISMMDEYIGKILDKLEESGMAENTLVIFTTDHGHFIGQHGLIAKGAFHYEDMIKVPFIAKMPNKIPAGKRSDAMQSLVDLAPTMLSVTDLKVPREMTGLNQWDVWQGKIESARDHVLVENHHQPTTVHHKTYVNHRFKITVYYNQEYGELFDLQEDPQEINNLWDNTEFCDLKSSLLLKLIHAELGKEPMWMPRVAGA